jgi:hypothetical protein
MRLGLGFSYLQLGVLGLTLGALLGCNAFTSFDGPSSDPQLLEAARACFDRGDYDCASRYYGQLSTNSSDIANTEHAFALLSQSGMTAGTFISIVLNGVSSGGQLVTRLANSLIPQAKQATRLNIFHAYQKSLLINDTRTKGLVRFVTSIALLSEVLAEASTHGALHKSDLVADATACAAASLLTYLITPGCLGPSGTTLTSGSAAITLTTATDTQLTGSPSLQMILAAITEVDAGISQMGTSSLGSTTSSFATQLLTNGVVNTDPTDSPIFRGLLISQGVGE